MPNSSTETTPATPATILNLNERSLHKIFHYLRLADLCSVAETCNGLKRAATNFFATNHRILFIDPWRNNRTNIGGVHLNLIRRVLTNFGCRVTDIFSRAYDEPEILPRRLYGLYQFTDPNLIVRSSAEILEMIVSYCCESLEAMRLDGFTINQLTIPNKIAQFNNLQELELQNSSFSASFDSTLFSDCKRLVKLKLNCGNQSISSFIENLTSIETLTYVRLSYVRVDDRLVNALAKFKKLATLKLLQMLDFSNKHLDNLGNISQLSTIKLQTYCNHGFDYNTSLVNLVAKSIGLRYVNLDLSCFVLTEESYLNILQLCDKRMKNDRLTIFVSNQTSCLTEKQYYDENRVEIVYV